MNMQLDERVSIIERDAPIVIVCPHGYDDHGTAGLGEIISKNLACSHVINKGWRKAKKHDYWKDHADCNDLRHCSENVVIDEFLKPIIRFVKKAINSYGECYVFNIHGMGIKNRPPDLDIVLGCGEEKNLTCKSKSRDSFLHYLNLHEFNVYKGENFFSGKNRYNLNQLFKQWVSLPAESFQLELVPYLRDKKQQDKTAENISKSIENLINNPIVNSIKSFKSF